MNSLVRAGARLGDLAARSSWSSSRSTAIRAFGSALNGAGEFGLNEDQLMLMEMAQNFADKEMKPFADQWNEDKVFPEDTLRKAAELGFGGVFVKDDIGGSGLGRVDGSIIFEALSGGCTSTAAYLTIHNMCKYCLNVHDVYTAHIMQ
jgi:alkylation response protein AidB-like acyl-CoA dehydrogenase